MSDAVPEKKEETNQEPTETKGEDAKPEEKKLNKDGQMTADNEIRVQAKGQIKNYLGYAFLILNKKEKKEDGTEEYTHKDLKISATGNAIVKALILIELVKRRVGNLHQINNIASDVIKSEEQTKIADLPKVETKRRVTKMETTLSREPLDEEHVGYQPPKPQEVSEKKKPKAKKQKHPKDKSHLDPDGLVNKKEEGGKRRDENQAGKHEHDKKDNKKGNKNRKKQLRDEIDQVKDDEVRGKGKRGKGGQRPRDIGRDLRDLPPPQGKRGGRRGEMERYPNDDYFVRPRGRGGRHLGPLIPHGPPRYDYGPYRQGPPQRGERYGPNDYYNDPYYYGQGANMQYDRPPRYAPPPGYRGERMPGPRYDDMMRRGPGDNLPPKERRGGDRGEKGNRGPPMRENKQGGDRKPKEENKTVDEYKPSRGGPQRGRGLRGRGRGRGNGPLGDRFRDEDEDHRGEAKVRTRQRGGGPAEN